MPEFFPGIGKIKYEGPDSRNPRAKSACLSINSIIKKPDRLNKAGQARKHSFPCDRGQWRRNEMLMTGWFTWHIFCYNVKRIDMLY